MEIKNKSLYSIVIYINLMFLIKLAQQYFNIRNIEYVLITLLFLLGIFIFGVFEYVLNKRVHKLIFCLVILGIISGEFLYYYHYIIKDLIRVNVYFKNNTYTYFYQYKYIVTILLPIITSIIMLITNKIYKKFIMVLNLAVMIILWFTGAIEIVNQNLFLYIFVTIMSYLLISYVSKQIESFNLNVEINTSKVGIGLNVILISFIFGIIINLLPMGFEGYDFGEVDLFNRFTLSKKKGVKKIHAFDLEQVGYNSRDGKMGGPVSIGYKPLFEVESDKSYYLRGTVKDYYDRNRWTKEDSDFLRKKSGEDIKINDLSDYIVINKSMDISFYDDFKSSVVFAPNLTYGVSIESGINYDRTPTIINDNVIDEPYTVYFNEIIDENDNIFINKFRDDIVNFDGYNRYLDSIVVNPIYLKQEFEEYEEYLQVSQNISKDIIKLANEITKGSSSYIEKIIKIQEYLKENYKYSLDVSEIPENEEFLHYFLFDEKKGYCTYFATAITIMCRINGIPARYVEGFKMPYETNFNDKYIVSTEDAHAWCEILVVPEDNIWAIVDISPTVAEDKINNSEIVTEDEELLFPDMDEYEEEIQKLKMENINRNEVVYNTSKEGINVVLLICLCILSYFLINIFYFSMKKKKIINNSSTIPLYNYYLRRIKKIKIIKYEYQGDLEFVETIKDTNLKNKMKSLVNSIYEEFYGGKDAQNIDKLEYYKFIEVYLKNKTGKTKYYFNKFIFWQ